jgi:CDP-diacylglycerol--glycerol-3-phosphate 3-phosphatidyltransferase
MTFPNILTVLRLALTPFIIYYFQLKVDSAQAIATILFLIAGFTDWYDGYYARKYNLISRLGQYLDPLADKILISGVLFAFYLNGYVFGWIVLVIVIRDFLITFLRSYALYRGRPIVTSTLAKWKTFSQMLAILAVLIYLNYTYYFADSHSYYLASYSDIPGIMFLIATLLTVVTGVQYLFSNRGIMVQIVNDVLNLFGYKK